jgi:hypothetical protein
LTPKSRVRAVRYRKLATAEPPLKGTAMIAPSVSVTALCVCLFYVGLFAELAHASKTDPYLNVLETDPHPRCRAGGQDLEVARAPEEPRRFQ